MLPWDAGQYVTAPMSLHHKDDDKGVMRDPWVVDISIRVH